MHSSDLWRPSPEGDAAEEIKFLKHAIRPTHDPSGRQKERPYKRNINYEFPRYKWAPFHLPHHTPETVKPRAHNTMYQVLPDQIYLNWPALSTYNPNPKEHNPRVVQAPMVEAAGPYVERDAPYYQNFEQNSYASGTLTGLCPEMAVSKVAEGSG